MGSDRRASLAHTRHANRALSALNVSEDIIFASGRPRSSCLHPGRMAAACPEPSWSAGMPAGKQRASLPMPCHSWFQLSLFMSSSSRSLRSQDFCAPSPEQISRVIYHATEFEVVLDRLEGDNAGD